MKPLIDEFPEVNCFLHSSYFIDIDGNNLGLWQCPLPPFPEIIKPQLMIERLLVQNFISIPAPIFKREVALKIGGLDEQLWYTADWDLWLKLAFSGDTLYCPKPLSKFRIHPTSQTVLRSSYLQDFHNQLESVAEKYIKIWDVPQPLKRKISKISSFSIDVNTNLAGMIHDKKPDLLILFMSFLSLGFSGWYCYLRDSRIWERVAARLKTRLTNSSLKDKK